MTKFKFTRIFAAAATAAAMTVAVAGTASAHGGGMGGSHMGGMTSHTNGMTSHTTSSTVTVNTHKSVALNEHNGRRRFRFIQFGLVNTAPACVYRWTHLGRRVLVCPDQDY